MTTFVPALDTTDFDRLVDEARGHIPRYAPDWTDHNLHDPGMTLIDLLAWIVDQQVYQVGFVSDRHLAAFAALLGREPQGPAPARGLIWPNDAIDDARILAKAATAVTCLRQPTLEFVLEHDLLLSDARLSATELVDGDDVTPLKLMKRSPGSTALPGRAGSRGMLILRADRPLTGSQRANISIGFEVAPPPGPPPSPEYRWGPLVVDYRIGDEPWRRLEPAHDGTAGLSQSGAVIVPVPARAPDDGHDKTPSELRVLLDQGFFPVAPQLRYIAFNVLPVVQVRPVAPAAIGQGTGLPDQQIELETEGIVPRPWASDEPVLAVEVAGSRWSERHDFERSKPGDRHYLRGQDRIEFGNGVNGRRPALGEPIAHQGFTVTKGAAGNLQAGLGWSVPALGKGQDPFGHNLAPITGGSDPDTIDTLIEAARVAATERAALLTDDELAQAARALAGFAVARAEVLPRFDARLPGDDVDGARTLVVVPHRDPGSAPGPVAPDYLSAIAAALDPRRVLGERLIVQGPQYERVVIDLTIGLQPGAVAAEVDQAIRLTIGRRLSDIALSDDVEPWPLGRPVTAEEIKSMVALVPGVSTVPASLVGRHGQPTGEDPVAIARDAVALGTVTIDWADDRVGER